MIAPEFRHCDNLSLLGPARQFITFNYGDGLWADLESDLQQVEQNYNQLSSASTHKTNTAQLEKYQDLFLRYVSLDINQ